MFGRKMRYMLGTVVALTLGVGARGAAQAAPIVGKWQVELQAGMRIEDGVPTPIRAKGLLTVVEVGDSLVATLKMDPNPDLPPRPESRFAAARQTGASVTFVQHSQAQLSTNDESPRTVAVVSTWRLTVAGSAFSGTIARAIEGMDASMMPEAPVTGTRVP